MPLNYAQDFNIEIPDPPASNETKSGTVEYLVERLIENAVRDKSYLEKTLRGAIELLLDGKDLDAGKLGLYVFVQAQYLLAIGSTRLVINPVKGIPVPESNAYAQGLYLNG